MIAASAAASSLSRATTGASAAAFTSGVVVEPELASGVLVELLPDYRLAAGPPVYAVYPARKWLPLKTKTFVAFLQERLFK